MCGILGEFLFDGKQTERSKFLELLRLSKKRGPDHSGYYTNHKNFQAGFNRLSVLDLSDNGNQPITSNNGRFVMVYNGEVYNYKELKNDLLKKGYRFSSTGDSEVIVNAFDALGIENTIQILDGMFSIGLFDKKLEEIYLIRDFAGIKPLFFGLGNKKLVFASQYDQIVLHPEFIQNNIDPKILKYYLMQHFIPDPYGIIKGTHQVRPGEYIKFNKNGKKTKKTYWALPKNINEFIADEDKAISIIDNALKNSVKSQLISDVPLGAFLSGGIDSPLICNYANKLMDNQLEAFTIGSDSDVHDESSKSKEYARLLKLRHCIEHLDGKKIVNIFEEISNSITEPFADFSIIPTYIVSKMAKEKVSVVLSGDGGDELFFGYERFWSIAKNLNIQNFPYSLKYLLYGLDKLFFNNKHLNSACLFPSQGEAHFNLNSRFDNKKVNEIAPGLSDILLPQDNTIYDYSKQDNLLDLLYEMRNAEFYGMMQKTLKKVDNASMANGLEVRLPFLKRTFIESSMKISPFLSFGPNKGKLSRKKVLLKKLLKTNIPKSPIDDVKRGFSIPLTKWLTSDLRDSFKNVLLDKKSIEYFDMNTKSIETLMNNHLQFKEDNKWQIFTLFSLFSWKNNLKK